MALPVLADAKAFLRIETTNEDALLTAFLARAQAVVAGYVGIPLAATSKTMFDPATTQYAYREVRTLQAPKYPFKTAAPDAPVVTDADGNVVDAATYRVDAQNGQFIGLQGAEFPRGPYQIVASVGMDQLEDYATMVEPILSSVILDLVSDYYNDRDPKAMTEATGGGVSTTREAGWLPDRAIVLLDTIAPRGIGW